MIRITDAKSFVMEGRNTSVPNVSEAVREILDDVRIRGDEAVIEYEVKFGGKFTGSLRVTDEEITQALSTVSNEYTEMLKRSAHNIREFHARQKHEGFMYIPRKGVILGQRVIPLNTAGIYVPGGTAAYPSTVLMNVIPAKIAGCQNIIIATPNPLPEIIASAKIAGATQIYRMGGAQAIGALAYGTKSVPKADKITGPGNVYVAEAKRQVYGIVDIDMIAGPSEIVIVADDTANPVFIASDMLAQSEHDKSATAILITTSQSLAENVASQIDAQLQTLPRKEIAQSSIDTNGRIIIAGSIDEAMNISDTIAPEHLELCMKDAFEWLGSVRNAGSVFVGSYSPEALGDYYAGANHTLPTMGTARFSSPLSVDDFIKKSQYIYYSEEELLRSADDIESFALSEGLHGHARSIAVRRKKCTNEH